MTGGFTAAAPAGVPIRGEHRAQVRLGHCELNRELIDQLDGGWLQTTDRWVQRPVEQGRSKMDERRAPVEAAKGGFRGPGPST